MSVRLSAFMWGLVMLSVARTTVLVRRRSTSEFSTVDGSAGLALAIIFLLLICLLINRRTIVRLAREIFKSSPGILASYFIFAIVSSLWSVLPSFSIFRALEVSVVFLTVFMIMSRYTKFFVAERTMLRAIFVITFLAFLQRAIHAGLSIEALHTNSYTVTAGMGFLYCLGESFRAGRLRKKKLRRWAIVFLLFLAVGTSVGSNVGTAFGVLVMMTLFRSGRARLIPVGIIAVFIMVQLGSLEDVLTSTIFSGRSVDELSNLKGRDYLWTAYYNGFLDRPFSGYGFAVGSRVGHLFGINSTTNTHNGFIEGALGLGIMGFLLLLYYFYALFRNLFYARRVGVPGSVGLIAAMAMMAVNNNSKSLIGGPFDPALVGVFVMLGFAHYSVYRRALVLRLQRLAAIRKARLSDRGVQVTSHALNSAEVDLNDGGDMGDDSRHTTSNSAEADLGDDGDMNDDSRYATLKSADIDLGDDGGMDDDSRYGTLNSADIDLGDDDSRCGSDLPRL